ncbi:MAG: hypothetical protein ACM3X4_02420 [Ignavibacteriales bacterium]
MGELGAAGRLTGVPRRQGDSRARIALMNGLHVYDRRQRRVIVLDRSGATVREALGDAGIPACAVSLVVAGDTLVNMDYAPLDGEEVCVYPPSDGG